MKKEIMNKENNNMVLMCIYIGLLFVIIILMIYLLTKFVF